MIRAVCPLYIIDNVSMCHALESRDYNQTENQTENQPEQMRYDMGMGERTRLDYSPNMQRCTNTPISSLSSILMVRLSMPAHCSLFVTQRMYTASVSSLNYQPRGSITRNPTKEEEEEAHRRLTATYQSSYPILSETS